MSARVIFIGDVFGIPSSEKSKDLANSFQTTTEIHIAPRTMIFKDRILGMYPCKALGNKSFHRQFPRVTLQLLLKIAHHQTG